MSSSGGGDGSVGPGERPREALKIAQIQGSSAGAGSGDFHTYRNARNLESARVARMEAAAAEEAARNKFERDRAIANFHLEQAAAKRADKRKRKKAAKQEYEKRAKIEATNALPNDGSFMELFLQKQKEAERAAKAAAATTASDAAPSQHAANTTQTDSDTPLATTATTLTDEKTSTAAATFPAAETKEESA